MEFKNTGKGADTKKRVSWAKILTAKEASEYTIENVLRGCDDWNPLK
jgi:pectinesterase